MNKKLLIKLVFSFLLLLYVFRTIEIDEFKKTVGNLSLVEVLTIILIYFLGQVLSGIKWWILVRAKSKDLPLSSALLAYFSGMFVNILGVGTVGGDMTRAVLISSPNRSKTWCIASVFADRAHGLFVLAMIGSLATLFFTGSSFGADYLPPIIRNLIIVGGGFIFLGWCFGPRLLLKFVPEGHSLRLKAEQVTFAFPSDLKTVSFVTAISAVFHTVQILLHFFIIKCLGLSVKPLVLFISIPFVNILSTLPISWQGLGVRENAYKFFLVPRMLTQEQAVALGIVWVFAVTASAVLAGFISLWLPKPLLK
jgi:glycosyltransferase 2 family protein